MNILIDERTKLYRGPRPSDLQVLKDQGFKRIISFETGVYEMFHAQDPVVRQYPCEFGMAEYNMPCSDVAPPEAYVAEKVIQLSGDFEKTLIHCATGVDRTGVVAAIYRMRVQGWSRDAAIKEWIALGRHWWYDWWRTAIK